MDNIIAEKKGNRRFVRLSRWNTIDYTIISRSNRNARYADNYEDGSTRLNITIFKIGSAIFPLAKFGKLVDPILLEDHASLSRLDPETGVYVELNSDKTKARIYKEVIYE